MPSHVFESINNTHLKKLAILTILSCKDVENTHL